MFVRLKREKAIGFGDQFALRRGYRELCVRFAPHVRHDHLAAEQFHPGVSTADGLAGFVTVFGHGDSDNFDPRIWFELQENVREERDGNARGGGCLDEISFARVGAGQKRRKIAPSIQADRGGTFYRKDGRESFTRHSFPAAAFSRGEKENENKAERLDSPPPPAKPSLLASLAVSRRGFVARLIARARVGVAVPDMRVVGRAG
ncbi:MAG: hypothetical protein V7609_823 [Verrucomicrobiota bacterium]